MEDTVPPVSQPESFDLFGWCGPIFFFEGTIFQTPGSMLMGGRVRPVSVHWFFGPGGGEGAGVDMVFVCICYPPFFGCFVLEALFGVPRFFDYPFGR